MRPLRGAVWVGVLVLSACSAAPAPAAWCNVFQVCWFRHRNREPAAVSYYYTPPAACCNPCQQCTTNYVQRCYYQPVTTYETRSYYEPVTTYQTSYYYEPVTSYRYSCYYDPCSCSYQQVATPTTSYRLRSQTCPVQSWVQRCATVPVQSYQQSFYWEPVTSCTTPTSVSAYVPPAPCASAPPAVPATPQPPLATDQRSPGVTEYPNRGATDNLPNNRFYYNPNQDKMPPASGGASRPILPQNGVPAQQRGVTVRPERVVSAPGSQVEGQVLRDNLAPWAGARVLFVSTDRREPRQAVTNRDGQFRVQLTSGSWLVYVQGADGRQVFYRRIDVHENPTTAPAGATLRGLSSQT